MQTVVVSDDERLFEGGYELGELAFVFVEADGEVQCRGLNHVGVDVQLVEHREEDAEVLFVHEGIVARTYRHKCLVVFHYERRDVFDELVAAVDDGRLKRGVEETADLQRNVLVLQRFGRFRV